MQRGAFKIIDSSGSICQSLTLLVLLVNMAQPLKSWSSLVRKLVGSHDVQSEQKELRPSEKGLCNGQSQRCARLHTVVNSSFSLVKACTSMIGRLNEPEPPPPPFIPSLLSVCSSSLSATMTMITRPSRLSLYTRL